MKNGQYSMTELLQNRRQVLSGMFLSILSKVSAMIGGTMAHANPLSLDRTDI